MTQSTACPSRAGAVHEHHRRRAAGWSYRIGEPVGKVAESIMSDKAVDGMRPVRSFLQLSEQVFPATSGQSLRTGLALRDGQLQKREEHPGQEAGRRCPG